MYRLGWIVKIYSRCRFFIFTPACMISSLSPWRAILRIARASGSYSPLFLLCRYVNIIAVVVLFISNKWRHWETDKVSRLHLIWNLDWESRFIITFCQLIWNFVSFLFLLTDWVWHERGLPGNLALPGGRVAIDTSIACDSEIWIVTTDHIFSLFTTFGWFVVFSQ